MATAAATTVAGAAQAEPRLVVLVPHSWQPPPDLDRADVRRLCLGSRRRVGGRRVVCVAMPPGSPEREAFNRIVLGMSEDELASYWIEQALLGGAVPPEEVEDLDALTQRLGRGRLALGYALLEDDPPAGLRALPLGGS